jgi:hypothetical protein
VQRSVVTVADHAIVLLLEPCRVGRALIIIEPVDLAECALVVGGLLAVTVGAAQGIARHDVADTGGSSNSQRR